MKIKIYQINTDKDEDGVAFMDFESLPKVQFSANINPEIYDEVFDGEVECANLEAVYTKFNIDCPKGYKGRSLSVSDVVEVITKKTSAFYFCDSFGFKEVDFNANETIPLKKDTIKVVLLEPGKFATITEIDASLEGMQKIVGGDIEAFYPFEEEVCLVCNEEGKLNKMDLNRAIYSENGELLDIIAGPCFICDCSGENFNSLTNEQLSRYNEMFMYPERLKSLKYLNFKEKK